MEYKYTDDMREISGFGGAYEEACRQMVIAGMQWFDLNPKASVSFKEYENVTGLTFDETDDCKALQKHMNAAIGDSASGAMMHYCLSHVLGAQKIGWEEYQRKLRALKAKEA